MIHIIGIGSHSDVVKSILDALKQNYVIVSYETFLKTSINNNNKIKAICAIGDNKTRETFVTTINELDKKHSNIEWVNAIHPQAIVATSSVNNKSFVGTVICANVCIPNELTKIGSHCIINTMASIDHHCTIKDFVHIAPKSTICGSCTIGYGSFIGASSTIVEKLKIKPWSVIKSTSLVSESTNNVPMYEPDIDTSLIKRNLDIALDKKQISSLRFEKCFIDKTEILLASRLNYKYCLLTNNGTSATHCLILALQHKHKNIDTIYVPNHVYVAVWNVVLYSFPKEKIIVMPFDNETFNIKDDNETIMSLAKNSALFVVHNVGRVVDVAKIKRMRPDLVIIEDCCESVFADDYDNNVNNNNVQDHERQRPSERDSSLCSSVSFYANKIITSGEGGAFLTNHKDVYEYIKTVYNQGQSSTRYIFSHLGYNYRMTNIQACILYSQYSHLPMILAKKNKIFNFYNEQFSKMDSKNVIIYNNNNNTTAKIAPWIFCLRIKNSNFKTLETFMTQKDIDIRPMFYCIDKHNHLSDIKFLIASDDSVNKQCCQVCNESFMLPSGPNLTDNELNYVVQCIRQYLKEYNL